MGNYIFKFTEENVKIEVGTKKQSYLCLLTFVNSAGIVSYELYICLIIKIEIFHNLHIFKFDHFSFYFKGKSSSYQ